MSRSASVSRPIYIKRPARHRAERERAYIAEQLDRPSDRPIEPRPRERRPTSPPPRGPESPR